VLGVAWQLGVFEGLAVSEMVKSALRTDGKVALLASIALAAAAAALVVLLSLLATLAVLYDFRLERLGDEFRVQCGLLTRHSTTIPERRIQFVAILEPWLSRWLGRATIKVETAGGGGEGERAPLTRQWFVPLVRRDALPALLREIHPRLDLDAAQWLPLAPRAIRRMRKEAVIVAVALTAGALLLVRPWGGLAILVFLPLLLWHAHQLEERTRYARTPYGVVYRTGVLTRKTGVAFLDRIQAVRTGESPFDRRHGMASLHVDTAGAGKVGHAIDIPYLERDVAQALREDLVAAAELAPSSR